MIPERHATKRGTTIDSVVVEPRWEIWEAALLTHRNESDEARADRAMLGLSLDRSVVMSGHQPIVFHPGIASKLAALMIASERTNSEALWIVPDQDAVDPLAVRVPEGRGETLREQTIRLGPMLVHGVAAASQPAVRTIDTKLPDELETLRERVLEHADEPTLARQMALATIPLAAEWLGVEAPKIVFASELMNTNGVRRIVNEITQDPLRAISAYNDAVRAHKDAGVRELHIDDERVELPFWRAKVGHPRQAVYSDELDSIAHDELLPRGLVMTGGARRTLGELFIHGTGGWSYDIITERWINDWLSESGAPITLVSATQRLELLDGNDAIDPDAAVWNAQHAKHDPAMLGDEALADEKRSLVERIERCKESGDDPSALFSQLQTLLEHYRAQYSADLKSLEQIAADAQKHRASHELAMDRTWPFVNFDAESGLLLTERVRSSMR